jgi:hypothetical protein
MADMRALTSIPDAGRERGAVLIIALVLLTGVTLIAVSGVSTSTAELRMAGAMESRSNNFHTAAAAIDSVISDESNLPTAGPLNVAATVVLSDDPLVAHEVFDVIGEDEVSATATRLQDCGPLPRIRSASSLMAFSAFRYEISATIYKPDSGMGRTGMTQGIIFLGPKC